MSILVSFHIIRNCIIYGTLKNLSHCSIHKTGKKFNIIIQVARSGRKRGNRQTDRQNDKTTTITLAAHACRGLIMAYSRICHIVL